MPSADQVPIKSTHSKMPWPMWVVLIAGSSGAALVLFALPTVTSQPDDRLCSRSRRKAGGFLVGFVPGHHRPCHPGELIGECDGCDLGGAACQQRSEPRPMARAMDLGIADHGECARCEQAAQIAIALLADTA